MACLCWNAAENTFRKFGFSNWGRAPHGVGWQPNLNAIMADNHFPPGDCCRGMSVMGASRSCSGSDNARDEQRTCGKAEAGGSWLGCSGNETSKLGRDCTPFADSGIGSYKGAMNLQLAWRRNDMSFIELNGPSPQNWQKAGGIPLVDGGVIEANRNATGGVLQLKAGQGPPGGGSVAGGWASQAKDVFVRG